MTNLTSHQRDLINDLNLEADLHDLEAQAAAMAEQDLEYAAAYGEAPTFAFISEAVDAARAAYFRRKLGA